MLSARLLRCMSIGNYPRFAAAAAVLIIFLSSMSPVKADTAAVTPTPIPPTAVVVPTVEIVPTPTPVVSAVPTSLATPTASAAIDGESSTPVATSPPPPTATPTPVGTLRPSDLAPTAPIPTVTATPSATTVVGVQPNLAPLPSPAQLQMDARLRWGSRVPAQVRRWAYLIVPAARKYHLNPNLIAAVMTMESNGDPQALSGSDARGLMQILHGPWDPASNVDMGAQMLAGFYAQFGNWPLALAAYNAGPGAVIEYGGIPPYRETRDYVIIVTYLFDLFDHHHLSLHRRSQYQATVVDLRHFADQRKKVKRLAQVAEVTINRALACHHFSTNCGGNSTAPISVSSGDPFWPIGGSPDPLVKVNPFAGTAP